MTGVQTCALPICSTDIVGRLLAAELTQRLKQQFVIDNRAGAGSIIGLQYAMQQPPDGYTLMMTSTAYGFLIDKPKVPVDLVNSFAPVVYIGVGDSAFTIHPSLRVNSVKELIDLAKKRPGELLYASSGIGGFPHMSTELFKMMTKTNITHVPFKGGGPAVIATASGEVNAIINSPAVVLPHVKTRRLRGLAVTSAKRSEIAPDLPALAEAGALPGYEVQGWYGVFAPRATPRRIVGAVNAELDRYVQSSEGRARLLSFGLTTTGGTPEAFADYYKRETERWGRIIRAAGIRSD